MKNTFGAEALTVEVGAKKAVEDSALDIAAVETAETMDSKEANRRHFTEMMRRVKAAENATWV